MAPVITLTTDFGPGGPFVAMMKAVIARHAPATRIVDLNHGIGTCSVTEAAFWVGRCYRWFPAGSVHVAVVDPGVGTQRAILAAEHDGYCFLAPDNGLLPGALGAAAHHRVHALDEDWRARQDWPRPSRTFHGRDIFAPLAAALATGRARPSDIGPSASRLAPCPLPPARRERDRVAGHVVAIDRWGNLLTDIDEALVRAIPAPAVQVAGCTLALQGTYADAAAGALLALVNSLGVVEVACNGGHAARRTGAVIGTAVLVVDGRA